MATSSSAINAQSPGLKTYFKTPEGRYKLQYEKTHPAAVLHYSHGKAVSQLTIAYLKEKPTNQTPSTPSTPSAGGGVRSAAARLLGAGNGSRALSFVGGNGVSRVVSGSSRIGGSLGSSTGSGSSHSTSNYDGKGTYLIFNAADTIFISDLNSQDKDPIKSIHFSNSNPICHAFDAGSKDGHDLLIGLHSGDAVALVLPGCQKVMVLLLLVMLMEIYMYMKRARMGLWIVPFLLSRIKPSFLLRMHGQVDTGSRIFLFAFTPSS
ncbi:hypothetical protein COCNU_15G002570 [Cocos nucifera]|uniref:Uncharacterized protein n=1 Tax=Cocos nucifera TaxID=13894 RepID=A0A8K0IX47_COCNU|nr:hypothetical protein COCNU_15G002570 [Cocos nucifera]